MSDLRPASILKFAKNRFKALKDKCKLSNFKYVHQLFTVVICFSHRAGAQLCHCSVSIESLKALDKETNHGRRVIYPIKGDSVDCAPHATQVTDKMYSIRCSVFNIINIHIPPFLYSFHNDDTCVYFRRARISVKMSLLVFLHFFIILACIQDKDQVNTVFLPYVLRLFKISG